MLKTTDKVVFYFAIKGGENVATIQTTIMIHDMMSRQFRAMNMAMSTVIDSFQSLQDATSNSVDLTALNNAQRELQEIESNYQQIENEIRDAANAQNNLNNTIRSGTDEVNKLVNKILGVAGAYLSVQAIAEGVKKSIALSDELTNINARLNLVVESMPSLEIEGINAKVNMIADSEGLSQVEQLQQQIFEAAKRSYAPYKDMADMVGKLALNARDAFNNTSEVVVFTELLNKQFSIAGTNAESVKSATLQLTQALGSGVLRGEEFNAIFEAAPTIMQSIADYLDVPIGALKKMASEGQITADIVKNAMFAAADDINQKFNSMPVTFEQLWTNLKSDALNAFQPILQKINEVANSERFQSFINSIVSGMYLLATIASYVLDIFISTGTFIYDHWSIIGPIIIGVAIALGVLAAAMIGAQVATWAMTAAQWALNAAMAVNPITWIIIAIILLIALFYAAVAAINHFAGTSISATGIVAGAFMLLYAYIYNAVARLWNIFATLAEFFVNVWNHPMYSVKRLFYNLASDVLDKAIAMSSGWDRFATNFVNAIISAVNGAIRAWNWFIDLLPADIASAIGLKKGSEFGLRTSVTSDLSGIKSALDSWVGEAPSDYWKAPRMEYKSYGDAWNTGYNWGANLFEGSKSLEEQFNFDKTLQNALNGQNGLGGIKDAIDKGNGAGRETANNTGKLANTVDMAAEDLKYLRDIAERDVINRFTTAEIKVEMTNNNNINSELDVDGIVEQLEEKVAEKLANAAEGVYA